MVSSTCQATCQAIACILLLTGIAAQAQTASISGKVTIKNKGVSGIVVVVSQDKYGGWERSRNRRLPKPCQNVTGFPVAIHF